MSPTPWDRPWIRLAMIFAFIQIMIALWMPDALSLQRVPVIIAPVAASLYLIRVIRNEQAHLRKFWLMVCAGLTADATARIISACYFWFGQEKAFSPAISDVFWLLEVMLFASALMYLFRHVQGLLRGVRFMLDILIVGVTFMTVSWEYFIKPELDAGPHRAVWRTLWTDMLYPLNGVVLIFFTLVLYFNTRQLRKRAAIFLCLGGSAYIIGDVLHMYLVNFMNLEVSGYLYPLHTLSVFFIGFAGGVSAPDARNEPDNEKETRSVGTLVVRYLLPYSVLGGMFALMAQRFGGWNGLFTG